ncbi:MULTISPECIES: hypothetical protein [Campylobacter]|uniref:hypothetical protein n=1 Tax=Campylobacter TaxID=194 RepID=UPI0008756B8A|nr:MULTISPECIES: hypothetical protein [Campylobacter]ECO3391287.1 hypothetical protein [Campylobacter jejuni]ECR3131567.1 hypothetical protein [Campylobacter jejuni]EDP5497645.1 hypothetical protein [Campylobacter jejuni]ELH9168405.1 hypothetical protein [Campylobacter jejuni]OEW66554.1 hypothetical protein AJN59_07705 [Campylobacter sp. BCW_4322]
MLGNIYDEDKRKIFISFTLIIVLVFISNFYLNFEYSKIEKLIENFISNAITFVSICFGFYLTTLSILFSSRYIKLLNNEDSKKKTQRQIHTLKEYFRLAIYCALITIVFCFLILITLKLENKNITFILFSFFLGFFAENFIFIFLLLKVFLNALVIQAKNDKE